MKSEIDQSTQIHLVQQRTRLWWRLWLPPHIVRLISIFNEAHHTSNIDICLIWHLLWYDNNCPSITPHLFYWGSPQGLFRVETSARQTVSFNIVALRKLLGIPRSYSNTHNFLVYLSKGCRLPRLDMSHFHPLLSRKDLKVILFNYLLFKLRLYFSFE